MKRSFRITRSTDIKRVRRGRSYAHPLVVLVTSPNDLSHVRVGVMAGHRVGGAVQRNRAKRRIRAAIHQLLPALKPGMDVLLIAREPVVKAPFCELEEALTGLVKRAGLIIVDGSDRE